MLVSVSGKEANTILKNMFINASIFVYYPESEDEMKMCIHHHQRYYNSVNEELKSDHTCKSIGEVAMSIESNMEYLWHYKFIDVTTFDFVGDSIIEVSNSGLKRGDVNNVSTNMNIDISTFTQLQIGKKQARKITSTYCVTALEIMV